LVKEFYGKQYPVRRLFGNFGEYCENKTVDYVGFYFILFLLKVKKIYMKFIV
jgi:hypothetical protein